MKLNETTYETIFLLYIDNELSETEKAEVEAFVLANPKFAMDFQLLNRSILEAEQAIYEDKPLLYRFESLEARLENDFKETLYRKENKLIQPAFNKRYYHTMLSIAALCILVIGYQFYSQTSSTIINNKRLAPNTEAKATNQLSFKVSDENNVIIAKTTIDQKEKSPYPLTKNTKSPVNTSIESDRKIEYIIAEKKNESAENSTTNTVENPSSFIRSVSSPEVYSTNSTSSEQGATLVSYAAQYEEIDVDNEHEVITISGLEINSDKLRGITRRVGSLLRRNKKDREK